MIDESFRTHGFVSYVDWPEMCSVWNCELTREQHTGLPVKHPCFICGDETAMGYGKFVNRVPADDTADGRPGYVCDECMEDDDRE